MSADLQYDLHDANAKAEAPVQPDKVSQDIFNRLDISLKLLNLSFRLTTLDRPEKSSKELKWNAAFRRSSKSWRKQSGTRIRFYR